VVDEAVSDPVVFPVVSDWYISSVLSWGDSVLRLRLRLRLRLESLMHVPRKVMAGSLWSPYLGVLSVPSLLEAAKREKIYYN